MTILGWLRCRVGRHPALAALVQPEERTVRVWCPRCEWVAEVPYTSLPTPVPKGKVAVPADEFDRLLTDLHHGMTALQERVQHLELALSIESAILSAVVGDE
jgi:hypothetical protein